MDDYFADYKRRVLIAEAEAKRFLARVDALRVEMKALAAEPNPRKNAAMKRASLDLSRALADVRRGYYAR